jgi:hypothetical protein
MARMSNGKTGADPGFLRFTDFYSPIWLGLLMSYSICRSWDKNRPFDLGNPHYHIAIRKPFSIHLKKPHV